MPHKFKIGDIVNYHPASRTHRAAGGVYTVTGLMPENDGELGYRIKHPGEDFERVAMQTELSASEPEHGQR